MYGKTNECYFGVEKLIMFLIFLEHEEFLKMSHFVYAINFPYSFVAVKFVHQ